MKKILTITLIAVLALAFAIPSLADEFVVSPGSSEGPELVEVISHDGNDEGILLIITPYKEREDLKEESKALLEDCYKELINAQQKKQLTKINPDLSLIARANYVSPDKLAVSELFDIRCETTSGEPAKGVFTIKLSAETVARYIALMHYQKETGAWEIVENATLDREKYIVTFTADDFSPFSIVTSTVPLGDAPCSCWIWYVVIIIFCLVATVLVIYNVKQARKKDDEEGPEAVKPESIPF